MTLNMILLSFIPIYISFILFVGLFMFTKRVYAVKNKAVKMSYFRSYAERGPEELEVIKNNFSNQFEIPVLFLITCLGSVMLNATRISTVAMGLMFILSRFAHFYFHVGKNDVNRRAMAFFLGFFLILAMWAQIMFTANA